MHEALRHFNIFLKIEILTSAITNSVLFRLILLFFFSFSLDVTHAASTQDVSSASPISLFLIHCQQSIYVFIFFLLGTVVSIAGHRQIL